MIIKMTVNDNDFTKHIKMFLKKFFVNMVFLNAKRTVEDCMRRDKLNELLNPNVTSSWNKEQQEFLRENIKETFSEYLVQEGVSEKTKDYLIGNLEISFLNSIEDKLENGESCYWFQFGDGAVITL